MTTATFEREGVDLTDCRNVTLAPFLDTVFYRLFLLFIAFLPHLFQHLLCLIASAMHLSEGKPI